MRNLKTIEGKVRAYSAKERGSQKRRYAALFEGLQHLSERYRSHALCQR